MASDGSAWQEEDWALFANLLRVGRAQLINHSRQLKTDRQAYFNEINHRGDLFLDPDTGIATGRVDGVSQYFFPKELLSLLDLEQTRIIAVYQHVRAKKTRDRLEEVIAVIRNHDAQFSSASYESGTVAMLFFSRNSDRVRSVVTHFQSVLGRHASGRINLWQPV
jgi:hypothetical protein